jgi:carbamoyltransferase
VMPSAADESLAIGAALYRYYKATGGQDFRASVLPNLYLGGAEDGPGEDEAVRVIRNELQASVQEPGNMNEAIADLLAAGEVVATCRSRMEWGARSLGNRSILSRADDFRRIELINSMIKMRDFWMPFAPSLIEESAPRYFADRKGIKPQFMTFAFPAEPARYAELVAASHPKDRTIRPQLVTRAANPDYHATISAYEKRSGSGAILNTSFNLHGEPIVYSAMDAARVLKLSALRHLALNRYLISKAA